MKSLLLNKLRSFYLLTGLLFILGISSSSFADCITNPATANAGPNQNVIYCTNTNSASIQLSGTIGGSATTATWTVAGSPLQGRFIPNANTLNAIYISDVPSNTLTFTLTATGGGCPVVSSSMTVNIAVALSGVSTPPDMQVCPSASSVSLSSSTVLGLFNPKWTTSGTGTFSPNNTTIGASYIPSTADKTKTITLTLSASRNECGVYSHSTAVSFAGATITSQPTDKIICENAGTAFSVSASGTNLTYTWQVDKGDGNGFSNVTTTSGEYSITTNPTFVTLSVSSAGTPFSHNGYKFRCAITSSSCATTVNSNTVLLTIKSNTYAVTQSVSQVVCEGGKATFTAAVTDPLKESGATYHWIEDRGNGNVNLNLFNSSVYSGGFSNALTLTVVTAAMNGYVYKVRVTNGCAPDVQTNGATLSISQLSFSTQPVAQSILSGTSASFTAAASATGSATVTSYQWQVNTGSGFVNMVNNANYTGATTSTLSIANTPVTWNGYLYQCIATNSCNSSKTSNAVALTVTPSSQTITLTRVADKVVGDPKFKLSASASSGLPVSFSIVSGPATIVHNDTIALTNEVGTVIYKASQAGNGIYPAADDVLDTFVVNKGNQTIALTLEAKKITDEPFQIFPVASSGLPVSISITKGPATLHGDTIVLTGATGAVTLKIVQAGNANYNAVTLSKSFNVGKNTQTITLATIPRKYINSAPFSLSATATSGLPVRYVIMKGPATVSGNKVTLTGVAGTVTIRCAQDGDATYSAAPVLDVELVVNKLAQTITFPAIADKATTANPFSVNATASSALPITYSILSGPATVSGNVITLTGETGTVTVKAFQAGNATYSPRALNQTFDVIQASAREAANETVSETMLYPNPSSGLIYIRLKQAEHIISVKIIDAKGNLYRQEEVSLLTDSYNVDLSGSPAGMYMIQVISDAGVKTKNILIY